MSVGNKVLDEDFVICVRPQMDKNFNWTTEVNVFIMTSENNPLNDDDYYGVLDFCRALCATIAIMEMDCLKKKSNYCITIASKLIWFISFLHGFMCYYRYH